MRGMKILNGVLLILSAIVSIIVCSFLFYTPNGLEFRGFSKDSVSPARIVVILLGVTLLICAFIYTISLLRQKEGIFNLILIILCLLILFSQIISSIASTLDLKNIWASVSLQVLPIVIIGVPALTIGLVSMFNLKTQVINNYAQNISKQDNAPLVDAEGNFVDSGVPNLRKKIRQLQVELGKPYNEMINEIDQTGQFANIDFRDLLDELETQKKEQQLDNAKDSLEQKIEKLQKEIEKQKNLTKNREKNDYKNILNTDDYDFIDSFKQKN